MEVEPFPILSAELEWNPSMFPVNLPAAVGLRLDDLVVTPTTAVALLSAASPSAACPRCGLPSERIHSRYRRTVADLPCQGRPCVLRLVVRKFRCSQPDCPQRIFCERLPGLLAAYARCTARLIEAHRALGLALGGEAGARLAEQLDLPTSPDTLLRRVQQAPVEPAPPPRYVGIDDWAIRKGQRYGTILIDLERGRVLDLLPGRDGEALKGWLKDHPGVEVITRDRWSAFARAAAEAAPQARQVADRWHLLKNLREAVERFLARLSTAVQQALGVGPGAERGKTAEAAPVGSEPPASETHTPGALAEPVPPGPAPSARGQARQAKRRQRAERHQRVRDLRADGQSLRQIGRATGLSVKSVIHYLRSERCPDWTGRQRPPTQVDAYAADIGAWIAEGGQNAAA